MFVAALRKSERMNNTTRQTTQHLLMIRPARFGFNTETADNNFFQSQPNDPETIHEKALTEFDDMVNKIRSQGIDVLVIEDSPTPETPDSIFPNNWFSTHEDGSLVLYPLFAKNRRLERKPAVLSALQEKYTIVHQVDISPYENSDRFLEGTGSMVLDRQHRIAYAAVSPRTHPDLLKIYCEKLQYTPIAFEAVDSKGRPLYHTNVVMTVADRFVVICLHSIPDEQERESVIQTIERSGKTIIAIDLEQLNQFAGNLLQVENNKGEKFLIGSAQAFSCLRADQRDLLASFNTLLEVSIPTIESVGGGSARCMLAEIFLNRR